MFHKNFGPSIVEFQEKSIDQQSDLSFYQFAFEIADQKLNQNKAELSTSIVCGLTPIESRLKFQDEQVEQAEQYFTKDVDPMIKKALNKLETDFKIIAVKIEQKNDKTEISAQSPAKS